MSAQLVAKALSFAVEGKVLLDAVNWKVTPGELKVLLGPSGTGKTTLLKILAGVVLPGSGEVCIEGVAGGLARHCAWMPQQDLLLPWRSVLRNVLLPHARTGHQDLLRQQALELLHRLGLEGEEHRFPWQLSQGMRQRVALARTLLMKKPFILLDEPCSPLDGGNRDRVLELLAETCRSKGYGMVMVSHQEKDVEKLGADPWFLEGGRLCRG